MEDLLPAFLEPWCEFVPGQAAAFLKELQLELPPGHTLHGLAVTAVAHSGAADGALFRLEDGRVADVHLTWSCRTEQLPYPRCRIYASLAEWVQHVMIPKQI